MSSLFWMAVKVMFQVTGEILGSDILGEIGNAKSWITFGVFTKIVRKGNRHVGVVRQLYLRWQLDLSVSVDCSDRLAHRRNYDGANSREEQAAYWYDLAKYAGQ